MSRLGRYRLRARQDLRRAVRRAGARDLLDKRAGCESPILFGPGRLHPPAPRAWGFGIGEACQVAWRAPLPTDLTFTSTGSKLFVILRITNMTPITCATPPDVVQVDAEELAVLLKALAHPARIRLLQHLGRHGTCHFGDLSDIVGLAPSTTSQHVKVLKEAGLVLGSADEQRTCYCVNPDRIAVLKRLVEAL